MNETLYDHTVELQKGLLDAFNQHDLERIMSYFSEDCILEMPSGPHYYGNRLEGREEVRKGLGSRFHSLPDVHYGDDSHFASADGSKGLSQWTLRGTDEQGGRVEVRGCDILTVKDGKIIKKDSYWKIRV